MKWIAAALMVTAFAACEKKPTAEEIEAVEEARKAAEIKAAASPAPTPKPWMWKDYTNPLDKKPTPR